MKRLVLIACLLLAAPVAQAAAPPLELMPLAGLGDEVPIYIQETGYPTLDPLLRSEQRQATALAGYVAASRRSA